MTLTQLQPTNDVPSIDDLRGQALKQQHTFEKAREDLANTQNAQQNPGAQSPKPIVEVASPYQFDPFLGLDNLVDIWYMMHPDTRLYPWQHQELLRISGYVDGTKSGPRMHWTPEAPFLANYPCCNDAGKDMVLISATAIGLPLLYRDVIVVITSSSHVQLKNQTQNHLERGIKALNARCGTRIYNSIEFYHSCPERGGEINMFATDEPGRAEGWHPRSKQGRLVLIKNEDKSIPEPLQLAFERCHGYSHWLNISSPGPKRGKFFRVCKTATAYPARPQPFNFWKRKIDWTQCPHISPQLFELKIREHGINSYFIQTSFLANFYEQEEDTVISDTLMLSLEGRRFRADPLDIGIGLDSAGGGDETALYVRFGPVPTRKLFFRDPDTNKAADRVHEFLLDLRENNRQNAQITFNLDDGGMSRTFSDQLAKNGWPVHRRLNNSKSTVPAKFMNLGTQMHWHVRELFERQQIEAPEDETTRLQLASRKYDETENLGRKCLVSKRETKILTGQSPDRGDAWVLCYWSFRPERFYSPISNDTPLPTNFISLDEFKRRSENDPAFLEKIFHKLHKQSNNPQYNNTLLRTNSIQ